MAAGVTRSASTATAFAVAALGIAFFSAMDAVMKHLALGLGAYNAVLWRVCAGAAIAGALFLASGWRRPRPAAMRYHLVRGLLMAPMAMLFFWGLARVPLAQGIALAFVAPLIALFFAALILKERIERRAILASLLGFAGVLVILAGQAEAAMGREAFRGALAILASAVLYAYNIVLMRQQALKAEPLEIAFFVQAIMAGALALAAPFAAALPTMSWWPAIIAAGLLSVISLLLLSWAYARAEAQHLAPVEYSSFLWAALFGSLFFAEEVGAATIAGAAMIVAACLIAARRRAGPAADLEAAI
ncbi:MAG: DMT family transporter [Sphingomonadaceae bacterium]